MPTYQYACTACDHRFDAVQSFSDASLTECPACSGLLRKVFSSVGIVFKGSGFYRTDSRAGQKGGESAKGETSSRDGDSSSGSTKKDKDKNKDSKPSTGTTTPDRSSSSSSSSSSTPASAAS